ncbi:MAG: hypothetical protein LIP03_07605 [Bacteroidales bacterium]|nr:hypothetical protein [Bacteroidales bacterium]
MTQNIYGRVKAAVTLLLCLMCVGEAWAELKTEKNGYVWEVYEKTGVKDAQGNVIIPPGKYNIVSYHSSDDGLNSVGYFNVAKKIRKTNISGAS